MAFPRKERPISEFVAARKIDEKISFVRNNHEIQGTIYKILENSVIVQITKEDANLLEIESNLTVVNHKNYSVVN